MDSNVLAFYLKYRPQTLSEVIGQEAVKQTVAQALKNNRLSHAYLFVGPRGTGKTSLARILAKMVNCEEKDAPCNKCSTCISITDGSNMDLIEIDAASNRGIEDIRSLREKIKLAPTAAKKKVYIIDEVHMLTAEAFNALLKTLEEPPKHALFILATTEVGKIPQTILSRCIRLDFSLATSKQLQQVLENIVKMEKIDIEKEALDILIKKADGSFRDGVKLLDQIANKFGKITTKDVSENLRSTNFDNLEVLIENFSKKETSRSLIEIQKLVEAGADMKEVILSLMELVRDMMLIKNDLGESLVKPKYSSDKYKIVEALAFSTNKSVVRILDSLQKAFEGLKFASIPQLPLELAVLEICGDEQLQTMEDRRLKIVVEDRELKVEKEEVNLPSSILKEPSSTIHHPSSESADSEDIQKLKEKWNFVLETIRPYNFSLEALLRSVRVSNITDINVIMEVPYSFHQRILEAPKNRDILEGILSDVLGRQIKVSCVLGNRPMQREDLANIEVAQDDEIVRIASEIFNSDSVN